MKTYQVNVYTKYGIKQVIISGENKEDATKKAFNLYSQDKIFNDACIYSSVDETIFI